MATDLTGFLVAHLEAHGLRVTGADGSGANMLTECFNGHGVNTPCLSIRKSDGAFNCFSCKVKGHDWKALIRALGGELPDEELPDPFGILNAQLNNHTKQQQSSLAVPWGAEPWRFGRYRGLSQGFLDRLEAKRWYDDRKRCRRILFPIWQHRKLMGWVARRTDDGTEMKYRNADGMKSTHILYPLDFVQQHLHGKVVVLVEGPLDALRLCHFRIPALAIMGTPNWRKRKLSLLRRLGIQHCIICTDGDAAGRQCRYETLEPSLEGWFGVEHFLPPDDEDPGSMDQRLCRQLRGRVEELAG